MGAVLVGKEGPCKGKLVPLGDSEVFLGRDETNSVPLDDLAASRRHCVIRPAAGEFRLSDLESRNGTFVNGVQVREHQLAHSDEIRVGESIFLFMRGAAPALIDQSVNATATRVLRAEETLYLSRTAVPAASP